MRADSARAPRRPRPGCRTELFDVLTLPDFERADAIETYWANPKTRTFGELLFDCEEDQGLRAVLVGCFDPGYLCTRFH